MEAIDAENGQIFFIDGPGGIGKTYLYRAILATVKLRGKFGLPLTSSATMTHRHAYEAIDRSLRDLTGVDVPFGDKVILFSGDFRRILPVVPKGTKAQTIDASFLLRVRDGCEPTVDEDMIKLPSSICVGNGDNISVDNLIPEIFTNLTKHVGNVSYMVQRAIITPTNVEVGMLNEKILTEFVGEEKTYYSRDSIPEDRQNLYQ
ncbi:uncharacterized protein LOC110739171 [Chenopodium quinoa]|uniref:uncharacterized protein LOC110739171 n=1 Tax=Chenopodium quinoa TaxID=63459 RepID=UPI000B776BD5|nr:uncharacterized protein LOC110739171 [Chenopodium quinoa]